MGKIIGQYLALWFAIAFVICAYLWIGPLPAIALTALIGLVIYQEVRRG